MTVLFNGSNQYLTLDTSSILDLRDFTLTCWINQATVTSSTRVVFASNSAENNYQAPIAFYIQNGRLGLQITRTRTILWFWTITETDTLLGNATIPVNHWTHVAASYDGNTMRVFVDGVPDGSLVSGYQPITGNINATVGADLTGSSSAQGFWSGQLADFRLYNRELHPGEIKTIATLGGADEILYGLRGRWGMNEGVANSTVSSGVLDYSINRNKANARNNPKFLPGVYANGED
jgi:hypothetical protein